MVKNPHLVRSIDQLDDYLVHEFLHVTSATRHELVFMGPQFESEQNNHNAAAHDVFFDLNRRSCLEQREVLW